MNVRRSILILGGLAILLALAIKFRAPGVSWVAQRLRGMKTVADRLDEYGPAARGRLKPAFDEKGIAYPPKKLVFVGLKTERQLQIYASSGGNLRYIKTYPILGASGKIGPKLQEGDCQVPEGIYNVDSLNPNSQFHVSIRIGYPNKFDSEMARNDGRENLGGDIMIHGGRGSTGCLAMGDEASEDLFVLAADTGVENMEVILSPVDFRKTTLIEPRKTDPEWVSGLYKTISDSLQHLPKPQ